MKKFNLLFFTTLVIAFGVFNSCDQDDDEEINSILGSWYTSVEQETYVMRVTYTFNPDLTLKEEINKNIVIETYYHTYTLSGNKITIYWGGEDYSYSWI